MTNYEIINLCFYFCVYILLLIILIKLKRENKDLYSTLYSLCKEFQMMIEFLEKINAKDEFHRYRIDKLFDEQKGKKEEK